MIRTSLLPQTSYIPMNETLITTEKQKILLIRCINEQSIQGHPLLS